MTETYEQEEEFRSGFIAVVGRPNVGKSTLLNQLLGQKIAIVSSKPQTTRDRILGVVTTEDAQFLFLDTPGIHRPKNRLGRYMLQLAQETISRDADLILWVVDGTRPPDREDVMIGEMLQQLHAERPLPEIVIGLNQSDRWSAQTGTLERRETEYRALLAWLTDRESQAAVPVVPFSALSGDGIEELLTALRERLPPGPPYYPEDTVTDLPMRLIAAEIVREKALELLRQEVPHSIAVAVTEWEERENGLLFIGATVYVERHSQKGIVLGHKGSTIKAIGQAARPEIEEMVGSRVYLELWVKVWEKWRRRSNMLHRLGYSF